LAQFKIKLIIIDTYKSDLDQLLNYCKYEIQCFVYETLYFTRESVLSKYIELFMYL